MPAGAGCHDESEMSSKKVELPKMMGPVSPKVPGTSKKANAPKRRHWPFQRQFSSLPKWRCPFSCKVPVQHLQVTAHITSFVFTYAGAVHLSSYLTHQNNVSVNIGGSKCLRAVLFALVECCGVPVHGPYWRCPGGKRPLHKRTFAHIKSLELEEEVDDPMDARNLFSVLQNRRTWCHAITIEELYCWNVSHWMVLKLACNCPPTQMMWCWFVLVIYS